MFRRSVRRRDISLRDCRYESRVRIEHVLEVPPVTIETVPGFDTAVFPFTTDIPFLDRLGQPLLFGPGSFTWPTRPRNSCPSPSCTPPWITTWRSRSTCSQS